MYLLVIDIVFSSRAPFYQSFTTYTNFQMWTNKVIESLVLVVNSVKQILDAFWDIFFSGTPNYFFNQGYQNAKTNNKYQLK